jgi:hypothetical protein
LLLFSDIDCCDWGVVPGHGRSPDWLSSAPRPLQNPLVAMTASVKLNAHVDHRFLNICSAAFLSHNFFHSQFYSKFTQLGTEDHIYNNHERQRSHPHSIYGPKAWNVRNGPTIYPPPPKLTVEQLWLEKKGRRISTASLL